MHTRAPEMVPHTHACLFGSLLPPTLSFGCRTLRIDTTVLRAPSRLNRDRSPRAPPGGPRALPRARVPVPPGADGVGVHGRARLPPEGHHADGHGHAPDAVRAGGAVGRQHPVPGLRRPPPQRGLHGAYVCICRHTRVLGFVAFAIALSPRGWRVPTREK